MTRHWKRVTVIFRYLQIMFVNTSQMVYSNTLQAQAQEYNYGPSMSSHAHVVSRLSLHVLLTFAAKSVRTRMIHDLRMQWRNVFTAVRTCTSPPPPLSLFRSSIKKVKLVFFYTVWKERRETRWHVQTAIRHALRSCVVDRHNVTCTCS